MLIALIVDVNVCPFPISPVPVGDVIELVSAVSSVDSRVISALCAVICSSEPIGTSGTSVLSTVLSFSVGSEELLAVVIILDIGFLVGTRLKY